MFYASKNASHGLEGESAAMIISSLAQYLMTNSLIKSDTLILIRNHLGFVFTPHSPPPSHRTPVIAARPALAVTELSLPRAARETTSTFYSRHYSIV